MSKQLSMFGVKAREYGTELYPLSPGYKKEGPRKEAAQSVKDRASVLRDRCLEVLRIAPSTADEVATALGESILSIRPRISELAARGEIRESGKRRQNVSKKMATVWEIRN